MLRNVVPCRSAHIEGSSVLTGPDMRTIRGGRRRRLPAGISICARMRMHLVALCFVRDLPANGFRMRTADITDRSQSLYCAIVEVQRGDCWNNTIGQGARAPAKARIAKFAQSSAPSSEPSHSTANVTSRARQHSSNRHPPRANASTRNAFSDSLSVGASHAVPFPHMLPESATQCEVGESPARPAPQHVLGHEQRTTRPSDQRPAPAPQWQFAPRA